MWNNKKYITSAEHEYINVKSRDRETACSFLYENSTLRKRIVFRFPHRVIKILSRLLLDSLICSGRAFVLSLFRLWSILILFQRPFITEVTKQNKSLQNAWVFVFLVFWFFPFFFLLSVMAVSACANVSMDLESFWNHSSPKFGLLMAKIIGHNDTKSE